MDAVSYSHSAKQAQRIKKIIANPDSTSGVVTVPSTIATGETITIPAGRTAILPDVLVEGNLVVDGTVFVPTGSTYTQETIKTEAISNVAGSTVINVTDIVSKVGNQDVGGIKNFTSSPMVPTPTAGDNSTKVATTAFCTSQDIGIGQTLQTFTVGTTRVAGTTYTNSTGKPIEIYIYGSSGGGGWSITLTINGIQVFLMGNTSNQEEGMSFSAIIPVGATYIVGNSGATLSSWKELR